MKMGEVQGVVAKGIPLLKMIDQLILCEHKRLRRYSLK
jgi:hypothetical protein